MIRTPSPSTGFRPKFFGKNISKTFFYASPNGYISFEFDETFTGNLESHFSIARISTLMTDIVKDDKCTISYNQPTANVDAITITWNNCHEYIEEDKLHSFQMSLFRNGDVRMVYRDVTPTSADIVIGLSDEPGVGLIIGRSLEDDIREPSSSVNATYNDLKRVADKDGKERASQSHHVRSMASINEGTTVLLKLQLE